jgi:hypothetical protein
MEAEMADEAARIFQEAMDAARREGRAEGYAEGYATAMRMVQEFSASAAAPEAGKAMRETKRSPTRQSLPKGRVRLSDVPYAPRIMGNKANELVEDAYQFIAPRAAGPTEIQHVIKERGADLPSTSVRRAIDRLVKQDKLYQVSARTWAYRSPKSANSDQKKESSTSGKSGAARVAKTANGAAPLQP